MAEQSVARTVPAVGPIHDSTIAMTKAVAVMASLVQETVSRAGTAEEPV
jgi:hypothetical protein